MADDFSIRYGDLLTGSYDCVDRIVLNPFFPLGYLGFGSADTRGRSPLSTTAPAPCGDGALATAA